ncbi:MAG: FAD-dependent oxidoreductase [Vicinamibacterales bacterium]
MADESAKESVPRPVVLVVDDDREVLAAIERDLRRHYRPEYRVVSAGSPEEALDAARELKRRASPVALFLVDQRMPTMSGTDFLVEARRLHPDARRVLLTAYADTDAAIAAINDVGLDHYLMKPWDPPDQRLYPVLDDLLADWSAHVRQPYRGIRVAGSRWSPPCYAVREFLSNNQIPYRWVDLDEDQSTRDLIEAMPCGLAQLPVVLFPDGAWLASPSLPELAEKIGMHTAATHPFYDVVVVGAGPSGLASAVYAASEGLHVLVVEQNAPGGQAGTSSLIENYLGFPAGVSGADLARRAATQAQRFGAEILVGQSAVGFTRRDPYKIVHLSNGTQVSCHVVVLAPGMAVRELPADGTRQLLGAGIYYGSATSEAVLYRGRPVAIVGGANSAGQGALFFARYASDVHLLVRAGSLSPSMSQYLVDRIHATPNITVHTGVEVSAVQGEGHLEGIELRDVTTAATRRLDTPALFIYIGVAPRTRALHGFVDLDSKGFVMTGADIQRVASQWPLERDPLMFEASVPGVFAVGDARMGANRRIAAAVGEGSAAVFSVHQYLRTV